MYFNLVELNESAAEELMTLVKLASYIETSIVMKSFENYMIIVKLKEKSQTCAAKVENNPPGRNRSDTVKSFVVILLLLC